MLVMMMTMMTWSRCLFAELLQSAFTSENFRWRAYYFIFYILIGEPIGGDLVVGLGGGTGRRLGALVPNNFLLSTQFRILGGRIAFLWLKAVSVKNDMVPYCYNVMNRPTY